MHQIYIDIFCRVCGAYFFVSRRVNAASHLYEVQSSLAFTKFSHWCSVVIRPAVFLLCFSPELGAVDSNGDHAVSGRTLTGKKVLNLRSSGVRRCLTYN